MSIKFLTFGSPEVAQSVHDLVQELAYAMGRSFDLEGAASLKPHTIILSLIAVAPARGTIPSGVQFKRTHQEFWSSFNVNFDAYVVGDARGKLEAISAALIGAVRQVPENRMTSEEKDRFEEALVHGTTLLLSEPDRVSRFQRPLT